MGSEADRAPGAGRGSEDLAKLLDRLSGHIDSEKIRGRDGEKRASERKPVKLIFEYRFSGDERTVCTHVTPISNAPMFKVYAAAPQSVMVRFHVGDASPSEPRRYESGPGYQGLEVRFAATPRDIHQQWQL